MTNITWEDVWFLLAVKYAQGNNNTATKEEVLKAGDFINHAILMDSEIDHAISALSPAGFIETIEGNYKLGPSFDILWKMSGAEKHRAVHKQLEKLINAIKNT